MHIDVLFEDKSPKFVAFDAVANSTLSIVFWFPEPVLADAITHLVSLDATAGTLPTCILSPKSVAFHSDAIVTNSIILTSVSGEFPSTYPPVNKHLVEFAPAPKLYLFADNEPNLTVLPCDCMLI